MTVTVPAAPPSLVVPSTEDVAPHHTDARREQLASMVSRSIGSGENPGQKAGPPPAPELAGGRLRLGCRRRRRHRCLPASPAASGPLPGRASLSKTVPHGRRVRPRTCAGWQHSPTTIAAGSVHPKTGPPSSSGMVSLSGSISSPHWLVTCWRSITCHVSG